MRAWVSAHTGAGIDELLQAIAELLGEDFINVDLVLNPDQGKLRARFFASGAVMAEQQDDAGNACLQIHMPRADFIRIMQDAGQNPAPWLPELPLSDESIDPAQPDPAVQLNQAV